MRPDGPRPTIVGPDSGPEPPFPLRLNGKVIKGFGRGSSELGIPTANIPIEGLSVGGHEDVESGVYYGWASLSPSQATERNPPGKSGRYDLMNPGIYTSLVEAQLSATQTETKGAVYPMCMSIGWNPYYKNTVRSVEVHIMHGFEEEFYGSHMNLVILGFIRPELDYVSMESLVEDIRTDIDVSGRSLARREYVVYVNDAYLGEFEGRGEVAS